MSKEEPNDAKKVTAEPAQTPLSEQTAKAEADTNEATLISSSADQQRARPDDDVEKLRRDQYELRDRINNFREKDLFDLREKVSRLNLYVAVAAAVIGILGFLGVKSYFDLQNLIRTRIDEQTKDALAFNEKYVRAVTYALGGDHNSAIPIYQELYKQKPEEEGLFIALLNSLNQIDNYDDAMEVIKLARNKGFLPDRYKNSFSFNNAGYFLLVKSGDDRSLKDDAYKYLKRAEVLGQGQAELKLPYLNLAYYHAIYGTLEQARYYGQRYRETQNAEWQWNSENAGPWLKKLEKVQPNVRAELEKAFAK